MSYSPLRGYNWAHFMDGEAEAQALHWWLQKEEEAPRAGRADPCAAAGASSFPLSPGLT